MARVDVATFLRHVEREIEGIEVFCSPNTLDNAEEALLQEDALLRDVVGVNELFHIKESAWGWQVTKVPYNFGLGVLPWKQKMMRPYNPALPEIGS